MRKSSGRRVLIVPDKFKGTLSAAEVCRAVAVGWRSARPDDALELLPMSDGGDGFGEVLGNLLGARQQITSTINAAHERVKAAWWWVPTQRLAIIESARVIGLAMLSPGKFHPYQLDTFGLGRVLEAAARKGARRCVIGIGGSATNDGGFGLARALGWKFLDARGRELEQWWELKGLARVVRPKKKFKMPITVAVDVGNPLLGARGCSRVYGPQKGLRAEDMFLAEACLRRLSAVLKKQCGLNFAGTSGAGAAGGLGFGLMTFAGAQRRNGFEVFAEAARLERRIRGADVVITGEGAVDRQTVMGKGVGQVARLCRKLKVPCIALAGVVTERAAGRLFTRASALTDIVRLDQAKKNPRRHLEKLSIIIARSGW